MDSKQAAYKLSTLTGKSETFKTGEVTDIHISKGNNGYSCRIERKRGPKDPYQETKPDYFGSCKTMLKHIQEVLEQEEKHDKP